MLGWVLLLCNVVGEIVKWFGMCIDIEEMKVVLEEVVVLWEKLEYRVFYDLFIGLVNWELFFE